MSDPIAFPNRARSGLHQLLAAEQWAGVLKAIENGYPMDVRNEKGQGVYACFIQQAGPSHDAMAQAWQASILEAMLARGLADAPLDASGHRPLSLAVRALRWDLASQLLAHGHSADAPGMPPLWTCVFQGLHEGSNNDRGEPMRQLAWRFQKTVDLLLDHHVLPQGAVRDMTPLDAMLAAGFDRQATRMIALGAPLSTGERPTFEHALQGASMTTAFRVLELPCQAERLASATRTDLAHWWDIIASRRNQDMLEMFHLRLTDEQVEQSTPDLAAACMRHGWAVPLGRMVTQGQPVAGPLADGRMLAHEAARLGDEDLLLFLRTHRLDFDLGPDPWTGLTPDETVAQRFPGFQLLPASILPFRRRLSR